MLRSLSLVSVLFALAAGVAPAAAGFNEDQKLCNSSATPVDTGIAACTRQISSGRWKGHNLAISYYNRGIFYYDKGDNDRAIADYTRALGLSPDYASAYNNRGNAYSAKGDLDRALTDYDRAIQIDGKDPFRWNNRALIWKRKGNYDLAIADFDQAIRIDPGYTAAYTNRGEAYEAKGDIERAKIDFNKALGTPQKYSNGKYAHDKARERLAALGSTPAPSRAAPPSPPPSRVGSTTFEQDQKLCNSSETKLDEGIAACTRQITSGRWSGHDLAISYYNRGIFYYDKDDNDRAIADYTKALELSPNYTSAFNNRGNAYAAKGELDRAIADYDQAIKIDPKDPFRWNNRGLAWKRKGLFDRAIPDFDQAIKIDPGYTAAYANRGETYEAKGDTERAKADYRAALAVPQKYSNGKYAHDKANERLRALGSSSPTPPPAPQPAGTTFEADQKLCNSSDTKFDEGIAACSRQIASGRWKGHDLAISFYNRGIFYYDKDELDKAISDYTRALELSPEYSSAFNNRGNAWSAKGDLDRALTDYDAAIRIDGKDPFRWNNRGLIFRRKGEHDRALADFDQAIKIDPGYTAAYTNRGQTYEAKGDVPRARADYRAALALPQKYGNGKYAHDKAAERLAALAADTTSSPPPPRPADRVASTPPPPPVAMGKRVALVLGNGAYSAVGALPNPIRDAEAISATLRRVGFEVTQETDLSKEKLVRTLRDFARKVDNADWALVYFAGHGIEVNGTNYLIPVDARLEMDKDVDFEAVPLSQVMSVVEGAKRMRMVLLDACRDNPFARTIKRSVGTRSIGRGLASIEPEAGTLVVYAAKHGETALDGDRGNSPFATALMQNMITPGLEIRKLFDLVRDDVVEMTNRRQQPFTYGSVPGRADFFFVAK